MTAKYIIKLLTLGDTMVGKTSIVLRFSDDKFDENQFATIGIDFKTRYIKVRDASVKVLIWDTAGQEKFRNVAKQYYKGANGVLLIYDICNRKSFERIEFWMNELKENNQIESLYTILVANKIDLEDKRVVTREEGEKYAENNNINYFEVSAKTGEGIVDLFNNITKGTIDKIFAANQENNEDKKHIFEYLDNKNYNKKQKKCCM
jgi:small GTP-binding protein